MAEKQQLEVRITIRTEVNDLPESTWDPLTEEQADEINEKYLNKKYLSRAVKQGNFTIDDWDFWNVG